MNQKVNLARQTNYAINEYRANGLSERFNQICKLIIETQNADYNIRFAKAVVKVARNMDVLAHGRVVLEFGSAEQNYDFARFIKGADTRAHREKIIESGSVEYNLYAGKSYELKDEFQEEYVNKHGAVVSKTGGPMFNYTFINNNKISTLDRQPHIDNIIQSRSSLINLKVAKNIEGIDIEPHSKVVAQFGSAEENFEFLLIDGSNKTRHQTVIAQSQDVIMNLRCLIEFPVSSKKILQKQLDVIFSGTDNEAKYEAFVWLKTKTNLKTQEDFDKYLPKVGQFIRDVKANKIVVGRREFRYLNRDDAGFKC
ncbi:MAG: hypothetical protein IJA72_05025 [Clostridia bacterium]|nr:hypothetical protein [Clostridia bacterium]